MKKTNLSPFETYLNNLLNGHRNLIESRNQRLEILKSTPSVEILFNTAKWTVRKESYLKWVGIVSRSNEKIDAMLDEAGYSLTPFYEMLNAKNQE